MIFVWSMVFAYAVLFYFVITEITIELQNLGLTDVNVINMYL